MWRPSESSLTSDGTTHTGRTARSHQRNGLISFRNRQDPLILYRTLLRTSWSAELFASNQGPPSELSNSELLWSPDLMWFSEDGSDLVSIILRKMLNIRGFKSHSQFASFKVIGCPPIPIFRNTRLHGSMIQWALPGLHARNAVAVRPLVLRQQHDLLVGVTFSSVTARTAATVGPRDNFQWKQSQQIQ